MIDNFENEYIFGDRFKRAADIVIAYPHFNNEDGLFDRIKSRSCVIFCAPSLVCYLFNILRDSKNKYILITHNDSYFVEDFCVAQELYDIKPPCIVKWFSRDILLQKPDLEFLPLGLNHNRIEIDRMESIDKTKTVVDKAYCNFYVHRRITPELTVDNPDTVAMDVLNMSILYDRYYLHQNFRDLPYIVWDPPTSENFKADYLDRMVKNMFIVSPPGYCLDCYRTWAAIYLGSIPIVRKHFMYDGYPVIQLEDWIDLTPELLQEKAAQYSQFDFNNEKLTMTYWLNKIEASRSLLGE